jgi:hypothetical protein
MIGAGPAVRVTLGWKHSFWLLISGSMKGLGRAPHRRRSIVFRIITAVSQIKLPRAIAAGLCRTSTSEIYLRNDGAELTWPGTIAFDLS